MAVIFFGISSEQHVKRNIAEWIGIAGEPVVFSERDDHVGKYKEKFLGKYDVVTIDEALKSYPDADVWITFGRTAWVPDWLAEKMPPERIRFLAADLEYRKGCRFLGCQMNYGNDYFSTCSVIGHQPIFKTSGPIRQRMAQWKEDTEKLIDDIRNDRPNPCQKCHMQKYGFWRKSANLTTFVLATSKPGDLCNFKCIYCTAAKRLKANRDENTGYSTYEILQQLAELPEYNKKELVLRLANGEFTVNKRCDEMLDILLQTKWTIILISNCSVYREKLATLMKNGRVRRVVTSIDAGTRETFKMIRQNDRFDQVVDNLRRYPKGKTHFFLKYIFMEGMNDNETDINGFYEIVKEIGGTIMLTSNLRTPYTEKMRELTLNLIKRAKADGIPVNSSCTFLHPGDAKFISESYAKA